MCQLRVMLVGVKLFDILNVVVSFRGFGTANWLLYSILDLLMVLKANNYVSLECT